VHKLLEGQSAGVNLVAEDESDLEEDETEDEDEGWWVGTIGAMEMRDQEEEALEEMGKQGPERGPISPPGRVTPGLRRSPSTVGIPIPSSDRRKIGGGAQSCLGPALRKMEGRLLLQANPGRSNHLTLEVPSEGN
jgi:hypothetical protein